MPAPSRTARVGGSGRFKEIITVLMISAQTYVCNKRQWGPDSGISFLLNINIIEKYGSRKHLLFL